jgi:NADP-dependent 3-hydroxy acid dehydrogenase YdfG
VQLVACSHNPGLFKILVLPEIISESFRNHLDNIPTKHVIDELQKTGLRTHSESTNVKVQNIYNGKQQQQHHRHRQQQQQQQQHYGWNGMN